MEDREFIEQFQRLLEQGKISFDLKVAPGQPSYYDRRWDEHGNELNSNTANFDITLSVDIHQRRAVTKTARLSWRTGR